MRKEDQKIIVNFSEKPVITNIEDIKRIAEAPAREQLRELASFRAKERDGDNYGGGYERKDMQWARRLTQRFLKTYSANDELRRQIGQENNHARWEELVKKSSLTWNKLQGLAEPFKKVDLRPEQPQNLSELEQQNVEPQNVEQKGNVFDSILTRADQARTSIGLYVGMKILGVKEAGLSYFDRRRKRIEKINLATKEAKKRIEFRFKRDDMRDESESSEGEGERKSPQTLSQGLELAKSRLNSLFNLHANIKGPFLDIEELKSFKNERFEDLARLRFPHLEFPKLNVSWERGVRSIAERAREEWIKAGLSKKEVKERVVLLNARFGQIARAKEKAVREKAEEIVIFGKSQGLNALSYGIEAAKSPKGRLLLAGGVTIGGVALLAITHPDIFQQIQNSFGQLVQANVSEPESLTQVASVSTILPNADVLAQQQPAAVLSSIVPDSAVPDAISNISVPDFRDHMFNFSDFASAPNIEPVNKFSEFVNNLASTAVQSGDTLWSIISGQADKFGNWVNPENGVTKADVVADITTQFLKAAGKNPDLIHAGNKIALNSQNFSSEQLQVIQDALNTTSLQDYVANVMPRFKALV